MKRKLALHMVGMLLLCSGCVYEAPLAKEHSIPIDPAVLGLWEYVPQESEKPGPPEWMIVLPYSDTEYLVHYPVRRDGMYFRAYLVRIGDMQCVQLQLIGTEDGPVEGDARKLFQVASYRLTGGELEVRTLNAELVDDDLKDSEALRAAFLKHSGSGDLFVDPGMFRKIQGNN